MSSRTTRPKRAGCRRSAHAAEHRKIVAAETRWSSPPRRQSSESRARAERGQDSAGRRAHGSSRGDSEAMRRRAGLLGADQAEERCAAAERAMAAHGVRARTDRASCSRCGPASALTSPDGIVHRRSLGADRRAQRRDGDGMAAVRARVPRCRPPVSSLSARRLTGATVEALLARAPGVRSVSFRSMKTSFNVPARAWPRPRRC